MAFRSASSAVAGGDGTSLVVGVPSGAAADDIAIVAMYMESSATVTAPSGFTQKADLKTDPSNRGRLQVFWKRLTGADSGSYTFTWSGSTWRGGGCVLFSGRLASGDPFDGTPGTAETGSDVTTLNVSASPAAAGGDAVGVWTSWAAPESFTPPTNYTERIDGNSQLTIATRDNIASGSTGNVTATCSASDPINAFLGVLAAAVAAATGSLGFTGVAVGSVGVPPVAGAATTTVEVTAAAAGVPVVHGAVAFTVVLTGTVSAVSRTAGAAVAQLSLTATATGSSHRYVGGISSDGRYFVDRAGSPILIRGESPWAMFTKLSSSEMDTYLENRASYGCNLALVSMIGAEANGAPDDNGETYDGILPFTGGNPTVFNSAYWSRMDSYIAKARDLGITLMIYPMDGWNTAFASVVFNPGSITNSQCQTYGQTLATRYLSYPNIIWSFGGDYNEDSTINARYNACLTGIRAAGDDRPVTIQLLYETSESSNSTYWEPKVDFDFVYTYYVTYKGVSDSYNHTWSGSPTTRPALFGEGAYENSGSPHNGTNTALRRQACWALTSGSPGELTGQEGVWNFESGWESLLDTTAADQMKAIRDTFEAIDWWTLIPDDANELVTAGRGTRITTDSATFPSGNNYVTAARAANGTLAAIYMPNASSAITVDMAMIGANPTATWVDPTTGATSSATVGSTYSKGNNAAGATDWLLLLTGDTLATTGAATSTLGFTGTASGADRAVGAAASAISVNGTALGIDRSVGTSLAVLGFAAAAAGTPEVVAAAAAVFGFAGTGQGFAGTPPVTGNATGTFGLTAVATGRPRTPGGASAAAVFTGTAVGRPSIQATGMALLGFTGLLAAVRRRPGAATGAFAFTGAAAGGGATVNAESVATVTATSTSTATVRN